MRIVIFAGISIMILSVLFYVTKKIRTDPKGAIMHILYSLILYVGARFAFLHYLW